MIIPGTEEFRGTERFEIQRRLGAGGFGVVYRAYDRRSDAVVALKNLREIDASSLYRFKQEFRALADLRHTNLVELYELLSEGEQWFIVMELIEGTSILNYVRGGGYSNEPTSDFSDLPTLESGPPLAGVENLPVAEVASASPVILPFHLDHLRAAFSQLAEGVVALHEAGILHRDLKPSNVLVTRTGRVVLLDFGLAEEVASLDRTEAQRRTILGTPLYMAPEQAAGLGASNASDWYSVGVMLYEALTGRAPFSGTILEMLKSKQQWEPPPPAKFISGLPEELNALCQALLHADPGARPSASDVLRHLGAGSGEARRKIAAEPEPSRTPRLVGREPHLDTLWAAFGAAREGRAVTIHLYGKSGMGKSTLVRHFLREVRQREHDAVVLAGRCYERESVPYKALDSLVDALSQYLRRLPLADAERLMPRDALALGRLFPVLRAVESVAAARGKMPEIVDSQELRRRGFSALRELLTRLADQKSVVLFIDDLQWGDLDSGALLVELMSPPEPPPLALILSYRSEEAESNPLLRLLRPSAGPTTASEVRDLPVDELRPEEAQALATSLLEGQRALPARSQVLARESGGSPLFLGELVRYAAAAHDHVESPNAGEVTLEEMILARASRLEGASRRLLEVVAVAGQPLRLDVARQVAELAPGEEHTVLGQLRAEHLARTRATPEPARIEPYHDRIREAVLSSIPSEILTFYHHRLASALEASGDADAETLAVHFQAAGVPDKAAGYAVQAAERAAQALAFDRAARLFRLALDLDPPQGDAACVLKSKLGDALANAGRGPEAAEAYLAAAGDAGSAEALDLKRRAAEQLLVCGHIDEGLGVLRTVLNSVGIKMTETPRRALLSLLLRRARLQLRGLHFRERPASQIPSDTLMRIDTCWSGVIGFSMVDTIRGADFQARHLLLALQAGEPYRVARALGMEIGYASQPGAHTVARTQKIIQTTLALAERVRNPHALGVAMANMGAAAFLQGDYPKGLELSRRAEAILRERCTGVTWELDTSQTFLLDSLYWTGAWDEMFHLMPIFAKEAQERGDLLFGSYQRRLHLINLAADNPAQAREEAYRRTWSQRGFHIQHYMDLITRTEIDLYAGDAGQAWKRVTEQWPGLTRSLLTRVQFIRVETRHLHARAVLALAAQKTTAEAGECERHLAIAEKDAGRLEREKTAWAMGLGALIRAGVAATRRNTVPALALAALAEKECEAAHMAHYAAVARRRQGELRGGAEGQALIEASDAWMAQHRIANRERMSAMLAPGEWTRSS
ncbi:MAG TPA: protein kinase [Terriglobia bacterium]|nr:protein kinase [Terriglobia bacterium]